MTSGNPCLLNKYMLLKPKRGSGVWGVSRPPIEPVAGLLVIVLEDLTGNVNGFMSEFFHFC